MAATPEFKVYTPDGEYIAACKDPGDAGALLALYGDGATIRHRHSKIVFTNGDDHDGNAADSFDHVAEVVYSRINR